MKIALIGHRGSGKSSLAKRMAKYLELPFFDLDKEVAPNTSEYFSKIGEKKFRQKEKEALEKLNKEQETFIVSLGAGFESEIPNDFFVYWVQRNTDSSGRIFLDRPRLNQELSSFEEFFQRKKERDPRFENRFHDKILLPEGFFQESKQERDFFTHQVCLPEYSITIPSSLFDNQTRLDNYLNTRLKWQIAFFEIRDDLLSEEQIQYLLKKIPPHKLLLSFRKKQENKRFTEYLQKNPSCRWDWPYELGKCYFSNEYDIYSCHQLNLSDAIKQLETISAKIKKLAPIVESFEDLLTGHHWLKTKPSSAFLPRSKDGVWSWYRLHTSKKQSVQFIQDIQASSFDQPSVLEALYHQEINTREEFAAVLGSPVAHSLSPAEHYAFFKKFQIPFYKIDTKKDSDLDVLIELGLKFAAVTAPLKKSFLKKVDHSSTKVEQLQSLNTLAISNEIYAENTDLDGLDKIKSFIEGDTVIWGGGGMLPLIQKMFPNAISYSAREAKPREYSAKSIFPQSLIWSIGREHYTNAKAKWPPDEWRPTTVIDINYTENSPGKEYAQSVGAKYISGMTVFKEQARKQQEFWSQYVSK